MGFADREGGRFFTIMGGKCVVRVSPETKGAVARVNKKGNTVHEVHHDSFEGKLVNIRTRDSGFGKQWEFDFRDGEDVWTLQLPYSNSNSGALLKILPNVDLTKRLKIQPSQKMDGDKLKSSLFISQDGVTLKHAHTRTAPNGMPDMVQIMVKGQPTWDDTAQLEFLHAMVERDILPKLPKDTKAPAAGLEVEETGATGADNDF